MTIECKPDIVHQYLILFILDNVIYAETKRENLIVIMERHYVLYLVVI